MIEYALTANCARFGASWRSLGRSLPLLPIRATEDSGVQEANIFEMKCCCLYCCTQCREVHHWGNAPPFRSGTHLVPPCPRGLPRFHSRVALHFIQPGWLSNTYLSLTPFHLPLFRSLLEGSTKQIFRPQQVFFTGLPSQTCRGGRDGGHGYVAQSFTLGGPAVNFGERRGVAAGAARALFTPRQLHPLCSEICVNTPAWQRRCCRTDAAARYVQSPLRGPAIKVGDRRGATTCAAAARTLCALRRAGAATRSLCRGRGRTARHECQPQLAADVGR